MIVGKERFIFKKSRGNLPKAQHDPQSENSKIKNLIIGKNVYTAEYADFDQLRRNSPH